MSRIFRAKHPGRCESCGERIDAGDRVRYTADGDDLVHADCDDNADPFAFDDDAKPCTDCFLVHAGECF
ncbi:hypothetical protein ACM0CQ_02660 [Mycobacteroides abscessus subsp. abscessus]|uniref:hypothetical protein n=1 Tax=Mycobacteroides abscessus TaxID=36809 RepID=UPI0039F118D5